MGCFYKYDSNGKIFSVGKCIDGEENIQPTEGFLTIAKGQPDLENDYIKDGKITKRLEMPVTVDKTSIVADEKDKATISGIPKGTSIIIEGTDQGICDDGYAEIKADYKGTYKVKLVCWPYLDKEIEINAVDSDSSTTREG